MTALEERGRAPGTAAIVTSRADVTHLLREAKQAAGRAISEADLQRLPEHLAEPEAVLFEKGTGALLYVFTPAGSDGRVAKIVVKVDVLLPGQARQRGLVNRVRTSGLVPRSALLNQGEYELLQGEL